MALIKRLSRLLTADVHAVLDTFEEPATLLRQAIREMEERNVELERNIQLTELRLRENEKRRSASAARLADIDTKLGLSLADDNEELARRIVRRKLELKRLEDEIEATHAALDAEIEDLSMRLGRQQDELEGMRQKAAVVLDRTDWAEPVGGIDGIRIDETEVEAALLAERQARQQP